MKKTEIDANRRKLLEEKKKILQQIKNKEEHFDLLDEQGNEISELSTYDNHPADLGSETFEREKDLSLMINARQTLFKIDQALEAIRRGNYGLCQGCGREISSERLAALPYVVYCRDCQNDRERIIKHRPVEEEVVMEFGSFDNDTPGMDGEDIWDLVSSFGNSCTPSDLVTGGIEAVNPYQDDISDRAGIVEETDGIMDDNR